jgi:hypothetical protein
MGLHDESQLITLVQSEEESPSQPPGGDPAPDKGDDGDEAPPEEKPAPSHPLLERLKSLTKMPPAVALRYVKRRGYANYWYNRQAQERLWNRYVERSAAQDAGYEWRLSGNVEMGQPFAIELTAEGGHMRMPAGNFAAAFDGDVSDQLSPPRSGGLLLALHAWQRFLDKGLDRFGEVYYLGQLPHGPDNRVEDCLVGYFEGMELRFFFGDEAGDLTGIELFSADDADPCEIQFSEFTQFGERRMPRRWLVRHGDAVFAELVVGQWSFGADADAPGREAEN